EAFMNRQIQSDGKARLRAALLHAGQRGDNHLQVFTFPSELCTDGGRAISNGDRNWPATLVGFAQRAYEFYRAELQPHGCRLRAEIVNFPGGEPGDVAVTFNRVQSDLRSIFCLSPHWVGWRRDMWNCRASILTRERDRTSLLTDSFPVFSL